MVTDNTAPTDERMGHLPNKCPSLRTGVAQCARFDHTGLAGSQYLTTEQLGINVTRVDPLTRADTLSTSRDRTTARLDAS